MVRKVKLYAISYQPYANALLRLNAHAARHLVENSNNRQQGKDHENADGRDDGDLPLLKHGKEQD